jgi:hypothetical protein
LLLLVAASPGIVASFAGRRKGAVVPSARIIQPDIRKNNEDEEADKWLRKNDDDSAFRARASAA